MRNHVLSLSLAAILTLFSFHQLDSSNSSLGDLNFQTQNPKKKSAKDKQLDGQWRSMDGNQIIFITDHDNNFFVRRIGGSGRWNMYYFKDSKDPNLYLASNGEKFILEDDILIWHGQKALEMNTFIRR